MSYYSRAAGASGGADLGGPHLAWAPGGAEDPFRLLQTAPSKEQEQEAEFANARRQDLMKEVFQLREEITTKEAVAEEIRKKHAELSVKLEQYHAPEEVRGYREELARLRSQTTESEIKCQEAERRFGKTEAENKTLVRGLEEQAANATRFKTELAAANARLELEMERAGQEMAWKTVKEKIEEQLEVQVCVTVVMKCALCAIGRNSRGSTRSGRKL